MGDMFLLSSNRNPDMENPPIPSDLALKGEIQSHSNFEVLYLVKEQNKAPPYS